MGLSLDVKLYIVVISSLALFIVVHFASQVSELFLDIDIVNALIVFSILAFLSQLYEVELVYKRMISIGFSVCLATVLVGGAPLAVVVTFVGTFLAEIILRWSRLAVGFMNFFWRVSFNTSQVILATYLAAWIFNLLGGQPVITLGNVTQDKLVFYNQIIPAFGAFVTFSLANNALVSGIITLTQKMSFIYHLRFNLKYLLMQILSLGILGILMAVVYAQSPWNLLLVLVPLGLVHASLRNYMKLRQEATKTFHRISEMLDARDRYTYEHSQGVSKLAEKIARNFKLDQERIEQISSAAVIHDIGKVAVPDEILRKRGPLTDQEWVVMKKHPDTGAELLKDLEMYRDIIDIVRHEHEHWDGSGYPKGLKGEEIPIGARIVAAADIYHALTTDRSYRPAYSHSEALQIIHGMSGVVLDPQVVEALINILENTEAQSTSPQKKAATP